jgi:hypothetical protein
MRMVYACGWQPAEFVTQMVLGQQDDGKADLGPFCPALSPIVYRARATNAFEQS